MVSHLINVQIGKTNETTLFKELHVYIEEFIAFPTKPLIHFNTMSLRTCSSFALTQSLLARSPAGALGPYLTWTYERGLKDILDHHKKMYEAGELTTNALDDYLGLLWWLEDGGKRCAKLTGSDFKAVQSWLCHHALS